MKNLPLVLLTVACAFFTFMLCKELIQRDVEKSEFEELQNMVEQNIFIQNENLSDKNDDKNDFEEDNGVQSGGIMVKYASLYEMNNDLVGWVKIENTRVNYPVMQTKEDEEFYLKRNFKRQETKSGTPFLSANSNIDTENNQEIIFGHNMRNDTMFGDLLSYKDKEFFKENQIVTFDTLYKERHYEIFAVFSMDIAENNNHFEFYNHTEFNSEKAFNAFMSEISNLSWYNIENPPVYGDSILTLITCDSLLNTKRFVVMAKLIDD